MKDYMTHCPFSIRVPLPKARIVAYALAVASCSLAPFSAQAQTADLDAAYQAALRLQKGEGTTADPAAAASELRRLADAGHVQATCGFAQAAYAGKGIARSTQLADEYAAKAAAAGVSACMVIIGDAYQVGRTGYKKNGATAVEWYLKAADAGDVRGMYEAGEAFRVGDGVPKDKVRAVPLLEKAAEQDHLEAITSLGYILATEDDLFKRREQGMNLLRKASERNSRSAQVWLGELLAFGQSGIQAQPAEGQKWLRAVADAGINRGMLGMARIYRDGVGVPPDWAQAVQWASKAYKNKDLSAAAFMGRLYVRGGPNLPQNKRFGYEYLKDAYGSGHSDALPDLQELVGYQTTSELLRSADATFYQMAHTAFFGNKLGSDQQFDYSNTDRVYYVGGAKLILHLELLKTGDVRMTMQAANLELLKTFYKAFVLDYLDKKRDIESWLTVRTQVLD